MVDVLLTYVLTLYATETTLKESILSRFELTKSGRKDPLSVVSHQIKLGDKYDKRTEPKERMIQRRARQSDTDDRHKILQY